MKTIYVLYLLILCSTFSVFAQGDRMKEKKEQIKALKVAFITTELDLSATESEKFWPVYTTYEDKQFELRHQKMSSFFKKIKNGSINSMSEKEANAFLSQMESNEEELFYLKKKFISNLKTILPASKIIQLKKAEENFNRKLLHQYRDQGNKRD